MDKPINFSYREYSEYDNFSISKSKSGLIGTLLLSFLWTGGILKPFINGYIVQFDWTLYITIAIFLNIIFSLFFLKRIFVSVKAFVVIIAMLLFQAIVFVSLLYSISPEYKYEKLIKFIPNILFLIYPVFIYRIKLNVLVISLAFILIPAAIAVIYLNTLLYIDNSPYLLVFKEFRGIYLNLGLSLGILLILINYLKGHWFFQAFILFLMFFLGARGPFLFVILVLLFSYFFWNKRFSLNSSIKYFFLLLFTLGTVFLFLNYFLEDNSFIDFGINRFSKFGGDDESVNTRIDMLKFVSSLPNFEVNDLFLGKGIGSFGVAYSKEDVKLYPHNILAEVFFELGLFGIVLLLVILALALVLAIEYKTVFSLLFLFVFLNSLKTNSFSEMWILYSVIGIIISKNHNRYEQLNYAEL